MSNETDGHRLMAALRIGGPRLRVFPLALLGAPLAAGLALWIVTEVELWVWFTLGTAAAVSVSGST